MINNIGKYRPCKYYAKNNTCPFKDNCSFSHEDKVKKIPCWFYNNGGCLKSDNNCICEHIMVPNMRKPIHLQHPCKMWHYYTPLKCRNNCNDDHSYELTEIEWKHHFPDVVYPGIGYFKLYIKDEFPIVENTNNPQPVINCVWDKSYTFKQTAQNEYIKNQIKGLQFYINNLISILKNNNVVLDEELKILISCTMKQISNI